MVPPEGYTSLKGKRARESTGSRAVPQASAYPAVQAETWLGPRASDTVISLSTDCVDNSVDSAAHGGSIDRSDCIFVTLVKK
jgi:hypothetical protein